MRAEASIDFTSLARSFFPCSKRLLFEQPYYRKFPDTCGCNPNISTATMLYRDTALLRLRRAELFLQYSKGV
jgi:hypothetical protein